MPIFAIESGSGGAAQQSSEVLSASGYMYARRRAARRELSGGRQWAPDVLTTRPLLPASMTKPMDFYDGPEEPLEIVDFVPVDESDDDGW